MLTTAEIAWTAGVFDRKGHLFTAENTIANRYRGRQCRICWNEWHREWDRKRRGRRDEAAKPIT